MKHPCRIYCVLLLHLLVCLVDVSHAASNIQSRQVLLAPLFDAACARLRVPKDLALAIARQESGFHPWIINISGKDFRPRNKAEALRLCQWALQANKSFDVGIMQVNTYWIKKYRLPLETVLDPQSNVQIGVWILAQEIRRHGMNWRAVAYYHTPLHKNPQRGRQYVASIMGHLRKIQAEKS